MKGYWEDLTAKSKSYYAFDENVNVSMELIEELVSGSQGNNARLCLHQGAEDSFHQMLILEYKDKSFPAHRHPHKSEGYHLIEGEMELVLYDRSGKIERVVVLNPRNPIARVGPNTFHKLNVVTPYVVYHETKPGPFVREGDKILAEWG